jgi:hypothetical protein
MGARVLLVTATACGLLAPPARAVQAAEAEILAPIRRLFDGMRAADSALARSAFDAGAQLVSISYDSAGVARVSTADLGRFLAAVGTPRSEVWDERIWDTEVRMDGSLAVVWAKYVFYRGGRFSHCGVDVFELVRRPDGWKIIQVADTRRTGGCPSGPP